MHRRIVYTGSIPQADDILTTNKNTLEALGYALTMIIGTGTWFDGLACTPTGPASMNVLVAPGSCITFANVDATAYGDLGSDTTHQTTKQGILRDTQTIAIAAPGTVGQSINYLIQGAYQDQDTDSAVLPYYNASNPAVAFNGPANSGTSQNQTRKGACIISLKAGTAATTGTQTTPAADAGFSPLYVVTVANGATSITSGNIVKHGSAPFIVYKLPDINVTAALPRTGLTGNTTYYVSPSGSDLSGTGAVGAPWQTMQHAYDYIAQNIDIAGFVVTVQCATNASPGYAPLHATIPLTGGAVHFVGDTTTPANCLINSTSADCFSGTGDGITLFVKGFLTVSNTGSGAGGVAANQGAHVTIDGNMSFGATGSTAPQIYASLGGLTIITASAYSIISGAFQHMCAQVGGIINVGSPVVTLTGTPAFSAAFAEVDTLGNISAPAMTFSGSGTGTRYIANTNGVIQTNGGGASFFPGNASGTTATGGQYN